MVDLGDSRFSFARFVVKDLEAQANFYRAVFGYGEGLRISGTIAGRAIDEVLFFATDNSVDLGILTFTDGETPPPGAALNAFFTADIEAFERRVVHAGGAVVQEIGPLELPDRMSRMGIFADPEGCWMEVIEG